MTFQDFFLHLSAFAAIMQESESISYKTAEKGKHIVCQDMFEIPSRRYDYCPLTTELSVCRITDIGRLDCTHTEYTRVSRCYLPSDCVYRDSSSGAKGSPGYPPSSSSPSTLDTTTISNTYEDTTTTTPYRKEVTTETAHVRKTSNTITTESPKEAPT